MSDLIKRQAAIDVCNYAIDLWHGQLGEGIVIAVKKRIAELPSVQPEIIHCKDCKHFGTDRYKKLTWCSRIKYGYGYQADDFCSYAEVRTDD